MTSSSMTSPAAAHSPAQYGGSTKLSSKNYKSWKVQMLCLVENQGLVGFIDGKAPPPLNDNVDYVAWRRTDWLLKGWILGELSDEVLEDVVNLDSARELWLELENKYSESKRTPSPPTAEQAAAHSPAKLSRENYKSWKEQMLCLVESQGLVGFIDGKAPPPLKDDVDYVAWRRTDWLLKAWILGALSHEVVKNVVNLDSARDVWLELENKYSTAEQAAAHSPAQYGGSTVNVANFISTKLSRENYKSWKVQMLCLVESQGLVGLIDGKAPPPLNDDVDYVAWRRTDWLLKGWILGALSDKVLEDVVNLDSARDVWLELENKYSTAEQAAAQYGGSAVKVANFVPTKLSHDNYMSWKEQTLRLVESQGLVGFIDGKAPPPVNDDAWRRTDWLLKAWILGALTDKVRAEVVILDSARDVWLELESKNQYLALSKAAMNGDWDTAKEIFDLNPDAVEARVALTLETALHIAVGAGNSRSFVSKLVDLMSNDSLAITDGYGNNPLHVAAQTGNLHAAKTLVKRFPDLLYDSCHANKFPVHLAADNGHRRTLHFLISQTRHNLTTKPRDNPFADESGFVLLNLLIDADFFDMALDLVDKYPDLATMGQSPNTALERIALKDKAFLKAAQLNFWERLIYPYVQVEMESQAQDPTPQSFDIENQTGELRRWYKVARKMQSTLCNVIKRLVPCRERVHAKKLMREHAPRLVECLCKHLKSLKDEEAKAIYSNAILTAARLGIHEIVEVIVGTFPSAIYSIDAATAQNFLHLAVGNRCEKVFNLLYQTTYQGYQYSTRIDSSGDTILHLAATLAPPHKLNLVSGAALQMQRELQWFKEVDKFISPYNKRRLNKAKKTPEMIFTEEHKNLKAEGEKWMKDTANSCTIAAALIATIVFAAAITVPGGNESDSGYPMLWESSAFTIFAVSDAVSLFTSTTSLLMFLSILTSRYAEQDFLYALPKRLCIGLLTLFLSILFMMAAFSSTLYLVFGRKHWWILMPVAALASLPVMSFVLLQFPLLVAVISSTYGRGIFGKQTDNLLYIF